MRKYGQCVIIYNLYGVLWRRVFNPVMHQGPEIWTSIPNYFTMEDLLISKLYVGEVEVDISALKMDGTIESDFQAADLVSPLL